MEYAEQHVAPSLNQGSAHLCIMQHCWAAAHLLRLRYSKPAVDACVKQQWSQVRLTLQSLDMLSYLLGLLLLMLFNPVYARHLSRTVEYCSTATQLAQQSLDAACLQRTVGFQLLIPWLHLLLLLLL
jgi:hypothetical protein